ncbi:YT521-B-like domain-containing protein [Crepidotus variabilis]|uniref:YT521-B-like domain-containing protein n=1 Tax=Crepidotus variabilis TaxID=179855 RepID=A0A9P6E4V1_9AGAR|nr:YT521-B-like domain-containing protein [Crepidotus variabilis]
MPGASMSESSGSGSNRRRSRPQFPNNQRSSSYNVPHIQQQPPSHGYSMSATPSTSDNVHNQGFQGSPLHYPPAHFGQRPSYVGQYTMSAQPSPIQMTPPPYPYASYHHPVAQESMMSQNIHANYQPMLQPPPGPGYPYSRHSPEGSSSNHGSYTSSRNSPYVPHQVNSSSPTTPRLSTTPGSSGALNSYVGSAPFQPLRYPSPMSSATFPYPPPQPFTPSMYQSQYAHQNYGQHYTPNADPEPPQGAWYYLTHASVASPQSGGFHGHYPPAYPYSSMGQADVDTPYEPPSSVPKVITYPGSSAGPSPLSQPNQDEVAPESPLASGAGPPTQPTALADEPPGSAPSSATRAQDRTLHRRSYHPNPPSHRSEWVMWAGNVPPDATHDELWRFFNQPLSDQVDGPNGTGVLSIFLISRSSCAFVNYMNEAFLHAAIKRFNGVPLRSQDPRCPRLVCRVRRVDDDLRAGVGGQRGMGMHTRWVKERKGKQRENPGDPSDASTASSPRSVSERMAAAVSGMSISSDDETSRRRVHAKHSSSSGSFASTNSSFLSRNFPERYFILKSLTQHDLDLSVERGVWATQRHNEEILDQAYRTSKTVYLIFGANKSGEFYGYARMAGSVRRGEQRVSWSSRSSQSPSHSPVSGRSTKTGELFFSPKDLRLVDSSPLPVDHNSSGDAVRHSAPALMGDHYRLPTLMTPTEKFSLDQRLIKSSQKEPFHLDSNAPRLAMRHPSAQGSSPHDSGSRSGPKLEVLEEVEEHPASEAVRQPEETKGEESWGDSFAIEWLSTRRLPFHRTRHLRNPWNHDREVKVSRDGTELEPSVGERLLEEWQKVEVEPSSQKAAQPFDKRAVVLPMADGIDGAAEGQRDGVKAGASRP